MALDPVTIGRFRVLGTLGQGAMGVVYLAEDPLLKRGVALKVVQGAALFRADGLRRFQREAEISARLNHPNIVTVFDVGDEPDVGPFIAMEYVEGVSLAERLKTGPLTPEDAVAVLAQLRSALESAHRADIIHRDVKPENILLTHEGRLKLMDFGIARDEDPSVTATSTASYLGTPAFAAPEMLAGKKANPATDRWAFAVTAFECILGAAPFQGETISATLFLIAHDQPRFPTGMAPALRAVFERAFDKEPDHRHSDFGSFMWELVEALPLEGDDKARAHLQLESGASPTGSFPGLSALSSALPVIESVDESASRHRNIWIGGAAVMALGLGIWGWLSRTPRILTILSNPSGALVMADGAPLGETPLRNLRIGAGVRLLHLEKAGFLPLDHELAPGTQKLELQLKAAPYRVRVISEPAGASVFLDGNLRGETPVETLEIPGDGTHILKVERRGLVPWITQTQRDRALPNPILLQPLPHRKTQVPATKIEEEGKAKKFFKNLFKRKKSE